MFTLHGDVVHLSSGVAPWATGAAVAAPIFRQITARFNVIFFYIYIKFGLIFNEILAEDWGGKNSK